MYKYCWVTPCSFLVTLKFDIIARIKEFAAIKVEKCIRERFEKYAEDIQQIFFMAEKEMDWISCM